MLDDPNTLTPAERHTYDRLDQIDFEERWRASQRRHWVFDILLAIIVVALAAAAWYAFPIFKRNSQQFADVPQIQKQVGALEDNLKPAGSKFDDWMSGQQSFRDRSEKTLQNLRARIELMENQVSEATVAMVARVKSELAPQLDHLQSEYDELQSTRAADKDRVASFEDQLEDLRRQTDQQAKDLAAAQNKMQEHEAALQKQTDDVAEVKQTQQRNRQDFDALNSKLSTERVNFEVSRDRQTDIAPGVALNITGIDTSYHRVNGWLWVAPDRNTIWIRGQSTQQPLDFYTKDGDKRELVITSVTDNSAVGYLIQPKPAGITAISPAGD